MTASDIPLTTGQTDNGGEGMRFMGYTVYDGLINWDLSSAELASDLVPGLATSWGVDAADKTKWTFKLRPGVKFHDGSDFTADAVVWNPRQAPEGRRAAIRPAPVRAGQDPHPGGRELPRGRSADRRDHHQGPRRDAAPTRSPGS